MKNINYNKIKAIETMYDGVLYRSRLEAQWAYVFKRGKYPFIYEPFCLDGWLPDFYVTIDDMNFLVEIKPFIFETKDGEVKNNKQMKNLYKKALTHTCNVDAILCLGNGFTYDDKTNYWGYMEVEEEDLKGLLPSRIYRKIGVYPCDLWKESINKTRYETKRRRKR